MTSDQASSADIDQAIEHLRHVQLRLHERLAEIELNTDSSDRGVNSIALIVRTLEKIDQLLKTHANERGATGEILSKEEHDKLRAKVKSLIQSAIKDGQSEKENEER